MAQHGTSVIIRQTIDGLDSAELRLLEMLHVVARDQENREKVAETFSVHPFILSRVCGRWCLIKQHVLVYSHGENMQTPHRRNMAALHNQTHHDILTPDHRHRQREEMERD